MSSFKLLPYYIGWHYSRALLDMAHLWKNFIHSTYHFFSIGNLTSNLFSPWQRMNEAYGQSSFFETFILNTLMRLIGFFIRLTVIIIGLLSLFTLCVVGILMYFLWLFLPIILILLFVLAVRFGVV